MNIYWSVNYPPAQHGSVTFSYRLSLHEAFDSAWSSRQGREAASPGWGHPVKDPRGLYPARASFLEIAYPSVDITACKNTEEGNGLIRRLGNTATEVARTFRSLSGWAHPSGRLCDGLENTIESAHTHPATWKWPGLHTRPSHLPARKD